MRARLDAALAELAAAIRDEVAANATPPAADGPPALLSLKEAARRLNIGRSALYDGPIATGSLKTIKVGRRRLVPADALAEFIHAASGAAPSQSDAARRKERRATDAPT
jgi:excisionase family DNA binding protein